MMKTNMMTEMKKIIGKAKSAILRFAYSTLTEENIDKLIDQYDDELADVQRIKQIKLKKLQKEDMMWDLITKHGYSREEAEEMIDETLGSEENERETKDSTIWR